MSFFDYPTGEFDPVEQPAAQYLLADASEQDWADLLRYTRTRRFGSGEIVISRGITDRTLFLIVEGTLEVLVPQTRGGGMRRVATLGAGSVIGELSFFDGEGRSASVRATTAGELAELNIADFDAMAAQHPDLARRFLLDLGRILAQRLRLTVESPAAAG